MKIKKGDKFKQRNTNNIFEVVGRWCGEIVLSPQKANDEVCLIYTTNEMVDFVEEGVFTRED